MDLKRFLILLCVVGIVACILLPNLSSAAKPATSIYTKDYTDPAGDVRAFYYNGTTANLSVDYLDFKKLSSSDAGDTLTIIMELKADFTYKNNDSVRYVIRIFTDAAKTQGFNVTYVNKTAFITDVKNSTTGAYLEYITSDVSVDLDKMTIQLSISRFLNGTKFFDIDAYNVERIPGVTYVDSITQLTGHPGVIPVEVVQNVTDDDVEEEDTKDPWCFLLVLVPALLATAAVISVCGHIRFRAR